MMSVLSLTKALVIYLLRFRGLLSSSIVLISLPFSSSLFFFLCRSAKQGAINILQLYITLKERIWTFSIAAKILIRVTYCPKSRIEPGRHSRPSWQVHVE